MSAKVQKGMGWGEYIVNNVDEKNNLQSTINTYSVIGSRCTEIRLHYFSKLN